MSSPFFRSHNDDTGGKVGVELVGDPAGIIRFSHEIVDVGGNGDFVVRRDGDEILLRCMNGEWLYRITGYDAELDMYDTELVLAGATGMDEKIRAARDYYDAHDISDEIAAAELTGHEPVEPLR